MKKHAPYLLLSAALLTIDLVSKDVVFRALNGYADDPYAWETIEVIPRFFDLSVVRNPGATFGLGAGMGPWLIVFNVVALIVIAVVAFRSDPARRIKTGSLFLILAGAIGNLYDRLAFGWVRDFLDFYVGDWWPWARDRLRDLRGAGGEHYWPFNIADACIVVGVITLAVILWREDPARARTPERAP